MKIDAFHYVQLGTAYRSVSSENNFLNAYMCKGVLLNLSVCSWHIFFFWAEHSLIWLILFALASNAYLANNCRSYFSQAFQAKCGWEDLKLFVMVNNTSGHVLCMISELQLQHAWVNVSEQTLQLGKDSSVCCPDMCLSSPSRSVSQQ